MAPARRSDEDSAALRVRLVDAAADVVRRDGASALTMRALANEAGCAVGLPYKLFANRDALIAAVVDHQFQILRRSLDEIVAAAGKRAVAANLARFAEVLLGDDAEVIRLAGEVATAAEPLERAADASGFVAALSSTVRDYVVAEQRLGRIAAEVDAEAIGFFVTGAVHNLVAAGAQYPRPDPAALRRHFKGLAALL